MLRSGKRTIGKRSIEGFSLIKSKTDPRLQNGETKPGIGPNEEFETRPRKGKTFGWSSCCHSLDSLTSRCVEFSVSREIKLPASHDVQC